MGVPLITGCVLVPLADMVGRGNPVQTIRRGAMDEMKDNDTRLRLERRTLWLPAEGYSAGDPYYCHRMLWIVDGIAGAVSFAVDMGGFRSGQNEQVARELGAYELRGTEDREARFGFVECGLAPRGIWAHALRPWPHLSEQDSEAECAVLEQRCFGQQLVGEHVPELHELLVRLVQPGGPEYVWEFLEEKYRDTFDAKPSREHELEQTRHFAAQLAQARAEGAARATGAAAAEAQAIGHQFADGHTQESPHSSQ